MNNTQRIRLAGWCGLIGGLLYFLQGAVGTLLFPQADVAGTAAFALSGTLASLNFVLLLIGVLGIAWGGALGGWFGKSLFGAAVLGYGLMIVGVVLTITGVGPLSDPPEKVSLIYLLGRLLAVVFTILTGGAVLAAGRWLGWVRFAPLLLGLWPLVGEVLPALLTGDRPPPVLNATWGLWGALIGFALLTQIAPMRRETMATGQA
jgi:hypothetical protein